MVQQQTPAANELSIRELQIGDDFSAFRTLNEEWISHYFVLEDKDREQLTHPENMLRKGGHIFLADREGVSIGCVALVPMGEGVYELSKMAVAPNLRGLGVGRFLMRHAIAFAKGIGAASLFLGSNTKLSSAVRLYESSGFCYVPAEKMPRLAYARANVFMELDLRP